MKSLFSVPFVASIVVAAACGSPPTPDVPSVEPPAPPSPATEPKETTAPATTGGKLTADQCKALSDEAQAEMDAEQIKVDHECKADSDCVAVTSRACLFKCENAAIPKGDLANWDAELKKVKEGPCKKWTEGDCATTTPPPANLQCQEKKPACVNKHCVMR